MFASKSLELNYRLFEPSRGKRGTIREFHPQHEPHAAEPQKQPTDFLPLEQQPKFDTVIDQTNRIIEPNGPLSSSVSLDSPGARRATLWLVSESIQLSRSGPEMVGTDRWERSTIADPAASARCSESGSP